MSALSPYRVLDLTTDRGWSCARLLADLGAQVTKVEPPGGDPGRHRGLFARREAPDPEANLGWWFENRGKRGVVVDLDDPGGRQRLLELVDDVDVLVESFEPGWLAARGLGPDRLLECNPRLVVTSITPFGTTGPRAAWQGPDLVVAASSGLMRLTGDPDRAPLRVSAPQLYRHAGAEAAAATLVALHEAQRHGRGQHVDVSAQCAGIRTLMNAQVFHLLEGRELQRQGGEASYGHARFRSITACADGWVVVLPIGGALGGPMMRFLFDWAEREGVADPSVKDRDFAAIDFTQETDEFFEAVSSTLSKLFAPRTKAELYEVALQHGVLVAPVASVADLRANEQLAARHYFVPFHAPDGHGLDGRELRQPGPWARLGASPMTVGDRAPLVGEHDDQPFLRRDDRADAAPAPTPAPPDDEGPFQGLRVLDLSWIGVGPMTAGYLGAHGATVVRVESTKRVDALRLTPPFRDGRPGLNNSHFFGDFNAGKLGVGIDLGNARGREVAWQLIEWADVILESFTPKALANWGMDYEQIRRRNPSAILLSTCMQGQTGPHRLYRGFGNLMGGLAGFYEVTGWPDRPPVMIYGAYTDFLAQRFCATALLAALDHRRRTGEGQHLDLAQLEAALQFLGPELLAYEVDGRIARRDGNRDPDRAPHGAYPCAAGDGGRGDEWVVIACESDEQWARLAELIAAPHEPGWATLAGRKADEDRLDATVAAWTATRRADDVVALLQPEVPAAVVARVADLHDDPQLAERGYWIPLEHPVYGRVPYSGMQAVLSVTPGTWRAPAPCLGQHTDEVLTTLVGMDPDEVAALLADGVLEMTG